MNRTLIAIAAGLMVFAGVGCVDRQAQERSKTTAQTLSDPSHAVTVQPAITATLAESVNITGDVTAGEDTTIGAKAPGKVVSVFVKDGDQVTAGQLLAQLDTTALNAQLQQAQASVGQALAASGQAQSALAQAIKNAGVGPLKSAAGVSQAEAQLRSAKAALEKAMNGARPEERRQAEANVASAKSTLDTASKELERIRTLVNQGALAGNLLDKQQNVVDTARAQYENAQQALKLIQIGTRPEDIAAAREQVQVAESGLKTAKAQKDLDPLLQDQVDSAKSQVLNARAQLQSAQASVTIARQAIDDAQIRSPFAGKIAGRPIQAGTIAGNGTAIARVIGNAGIYFSGQLPSVEVSKVHTGMPVKVTVDAVPGKTFDGTVAAVSSLGDGVGRLFDVRVQLSDGIADIKPGMFVHGTIQTRVVNDATIVPDEAIVTEGDDSFVLLAKGAKAEKVKVTTGLHQGSKIEVKGIPSGAPVIIRGQVGLSNGAPIKVDTSPEAKKEGTSAEG